MEDFPTLRVDSLAFGGDGVGRLGGKACFVAFACPGDLAAVRIVEEHASYLRAELVELVEPGPSRREAACPYFGRCGGCHWQHVAYPAQLAAKVGQLAESMRRIAHLEPRILPIVPSDEEYGYRTRARLRAARGGRVGYFARSSHELVAVDRCPILAPALERRLGELAAPPAGPSRRPGEARANARRLRVDGRPEELELRLTEEGGAVERLFGSPAAKGGPLRAASTSGASAEEEAFHQVNRFVNPRLVRAVGEAIEAALPPGRTLEVLDLYCGDGNLSLPLAARGARVAGFDTSEEAIRSAAEAARSRGLAHAIYSRMDAESALRELAARERSAPRDPARFRCLIADPPRAGLRKAADALIAALPDLIVYVSCSPPALARDALALVAGGLELELLQPFDMFPQTYHLETMALFTARPRREGSGARRSSG